MRCLWLVDSYYDATYLWTNVVGIGGGVLSPPPSHPYWQGPSPRFHHLDGPVLCLGGCEYSTPFFYLVHQKHKYTSSDCGNIELIPCRVSSLSC